MDQLKEFLNQAVKHRFWVAIGVAALMSLCAYFLGTGAMAEEEKKEAAKIKGAVDGVKKYTSGQVKNKPWTDTVVEKTGLVQKDVIASWIKLYDKQAPLLDWPAPVKKEFEDPAWDRKYPEGVDPQRVRDVILEYTQAYPDYADEIYKSFRPFNPEDGTGIVVAPSKAALLRTQVYEESRLPTLGEVWSAQQKLWIQRTILKVIADVNARAKAKDWDSAVIKQILMLEVANAFAVDQRSDAKGEGTLEDPPEILAPGQAPATEKTAAASSSGKFGDGGAFGGGGGGGASTTPEKIQFVKSPNPDQYFIVPIALTVFIEQDRIPDLLVEFKNSPMTIRVFDVRWIKPSTPVKKPRKGQALPGAPGGMGGRSMMGGENLLGSSEMAMSMGGRLDGGSSGVASGYSKSLKAGGGSGPGGTNAPKGREGGKDVKDANLKALVLKGKDKKGQEKKSTKDDEPEATTGSNPYFNVVEVTIRGQARFYKAPPKPAAPAPEQFPGAAPEPAKDASAKADTPKADAAKDATAKDQPKAEPAKGEAPKDQPKDAPKPEPAKGAPAKDAAPQPEPAKTDAPKAVTPKADAPAPKPDAPKDTTPKGDAPKGDTGKPKGTEAPKA
ncbi:MAG: hypothetical protein JWN86_2098 [Planctomycetota bacterium]|nr:hypothetical protein [Planctomycetota bacterium]